MKIVSSLLLPGFILLGLWGAPAGSEGISRIAVVDPALDLATQLIQTEGEVGEMPVPQAPRLVVGQGAHSQNHTFISILNEYGISTRKFLAYPSTIRGGVAVHTGSFDGWFGRAIITAPLSSDLTREIRMFDQEGLLQVVWMVSEPYAPPYQLAVGDFLSSNSGDEVALCCRNPTQESIDIRIYHPGGELLRTIPMFDVLTQVQPFSISTVHLSGLDLLVCGVSSDRRSILIKPETGEMKEISAPAQSLSGGVYESAFMEDLVVGGILDQTFSRLWVRDQIGTNKVLDVGLRENRFYIHPISNLPGFTDSQYVRNGLFRHLRTDQASPGYVGADFDNTDFAYWAGGTYNEYITGTQADYYSRPPALWEPTFTHRHHDFASVPWHDAIDPQSEKPRFMMLSRNDTICVYQEGTTNFNGMSYAPNNPTLDRLYVWPLRAYLRELVKKYRGPQGNPDQMVGLEPNHEMEIFVPQDDGIGDYNPGMISSFQEHLLLLYTTHSKINQRFGITTSGTASFDPPRNQNRGTWDRYQTSNPFYNAWVEFNRKVIFYRIMQGMREALLAGFPPELLKTHQIPDGEAVGSVLAGKRITPIDWILTAGTSYGGTRYGLFYTNPNNWIKGAFTSGQTLSTIGEYHPLTTSEAEAFNQLLHLHTNGVQFIHQMTFGGAEDLPARKAYADLSILNYPRPGTTGGIGQIRAVTRQEGEVLKRFNIACIGSENRPGLLKSLNREGTFEGTVYVTPFHARQVVEVLKENQTINLHQNQVVEGPVTGLYAGDQLEIQCEVLPQNPGEQMTLLVLHDGIELAGQRQVMTLAGGWQFLRYILRVQQPMEGIHILMNSGERDTPSGFVPNLSIRNYSVYVEREKVARMEYGTPLGEPHLGGVSFDLMSAEDVPVETMENPFPDPTPTPVPLGQIRVY